jgi:cephalosporin hydroxylase
MLQETKPPTIIEIGAFNGGGALWMADLMKIHEVETHVYSMDIDFSYLEAGLFKERNDITLIHGDSFKISEAFPEDMLKVKMRRGRELE